MNIEAGQTSGDSGSVSRPFQMERTWINDLHRQRKLHQAQVHGLRRGLPGRLLLRGREHARHPPDECIDWGVCEPECPVDAIKPDTEPGLEKWLELNREYAKQWPNITVKREPPGDAKEWEGKPDKEKEFSPNPGQGD